MSAVKPLKFVVLGSGGMAGAHVNQLTSLAGVTPVGFHDIAPAALEKWKEKFPQAVVELDAAKLLARTKPDVAVIASSNNAHASLTLSAIDAGCHVMCEKPMSMTVAEAERMEKSRITAGKLGAINFSYRCVAAFRFARELIRAGELGRIQRLNVVYLQGWLANSPWTWRNDITVAGFGALGDLGSHMIDGATFVSGLAPKRVVGLAQTLIPEKIDATGHPKPVTTDTNASFLVEYVTGAIGTFETSQTIPGYGNHFRIEASGDRGVLRVCSEDNEGLILYAGQTLSKWGTWHKESFPRVLVPGDFVNRQPKSNNESFVRAVRGDNDADFPTFADGLAAQRVLNGIVESTQTKQWVDV